jgi:3',5'-cyclic AMP phosphodiesterase CpdA
VTFEISTKRYATPNARYLLGAGDLTQEGSEEELARFRRELEALDIPYYATLGNHDIGEGSPIPYQEWFGRGSFSYVFRDVRFSMLDSASGNAGPAPHIEATIARVESAQAPERQGYDESPSPHRACRPNCSTRDRKNSHHRREEQVLQRRGTTVRGNSG